MKPDSLDVKGYYDEKKKRCFAKAIMFISLPNGKSKMFVGKGDTIKYDGDVENKEYAIALASARAVKEVYRQYIDFLLMYSHRFSNNKVKKTVLAEQIFKEQMSNLREHIPHNPSKSSEIHITNKGIDTLHDLIGGMANPIFTKGMMGK